MMDKILILRKKLDEAVEKEGLNSAKVKKLSEKFDKELNKYLREEKRYNVNNNMYISYKIAISELRRISKEFDKFPTTEEWNKYAKEKELINSESIKYISGLNWHNLRNRILGEINIIKKN